MGVCLWTVSYTHLVGGYGVHAAKVARTGVPFYLSHTIVKAEGEEYVTGVCLLYTSCV